MAISESDVIPEVAERQVWQALNGIKNIATGPDDMPWWMKIMCMRRFSQAWLQRSGTFSS